MARKKEPDWDALKAEYASTRISVRKMAVRENIPENTLEKRSIRDKWGEARRNVAGKVAEQMPAVVANVVVAETARYIRKHLTGLDEVWDMILGQARTLVVTETLPPKPSSKPKADDDQDDDLDEPKPIVVTPLDRLLGLRRAASGLRDLQSGIRKTLGMDDMKGGDDPADPLDRLTEAIQASKELLEAQQRVQPEEGASE